MSRKPSNWLVEQADQLHRSGHTREAIETLTETVNVDPGFAPAWYRLGYLHRANGEWSKALSAYRKALDLGIEKPEEVHLNISVILTDGLRRDDQAMEALETSLSLAPDYLPALLNLGNLHEEHGRRDDALAVYDRVLEIPAERITEHAELQAEALARSVQLRQPTSMEDPVFARIETASSGSGPATSTVRANLQFAAGRAYDKLGATQHAFDAFSRANRHLRRAGGGRYDRASTERFIDRIINAFPSAGSAEDIKGEFSRNPVFICGLFRSGSTLVEQILATHPHVIAGGELEFLLREAFGGVYAPFPENCGNASDPRDSAVRIRYLDMLQELFADAPNGALVTDKRPDNFLLLGLIKRLFPHAHVIHTHRNPMDVGLSIYMQHLNPAVTPYSMDLGDIGHYIAQHDRLMGHWRQLYPGDIHSFDYDLFVSDPDEQVNSLFPALGLVPPEDVMDFHARGGSVKTASYWQVRRPLYKEASGRWKRYKAELEPLAQSLRESGLSVSADASDHS